MSHLKGVRLPDASAPVKRQKLTKAATQTSQAAAAAAAAATKTTAVPTADISAMQSEPDAQQMLAAVDTLASLAKGSGSASAANQAVSGLLLLLSSTDDSQVTTAAAAALFEAVEGLKSTTKATAAAAYQAVSGLLRLLSNEKKSAAARNAAARALLRVVRYDNCIAAVIDALCEDQSEEWSESLQELVSVISSSSSGGGSSFLPTTLTDLKLHSAHILLRLIRIHDHNLRVAVHAYEIVPALLSLLNELPDKVLACALVRRMSGPEYNIWYESNAELVIQALVALIKDHLDDSEILLPAICALRSACAADLDDIDGEILEMNQDRLAEAGGIEVLKQVVKAAKSQGMEDVGVAAKKALRNALYDSDADSESEGSDESPDEASEECETEEE